jgi:peptidoglycan/xylan/chitin deacetylase (PgdA/CDA1 family)
MNETIPHTLLSIDLEDYFQIESFETVIPVRYWPRLERRLDATVQLWLALLESSNATATFFAGQWAADMHPGAIKQIAAAGHEVAALIMPTKQDTQSDLREFGSNIAELRHALEQIIGRQVAGCRLARGTMSASTLKAARSAGYLYDSSEHEVSTECPKGIRHVPPAASRFGGLSVAALWQHAPDRLAPAVMGLTTWKPRVRRFSVSALDTEQPRITALSRFQQTVLYRNIGRLAERTRAHISARAGSSIAKGLGLELATVAIAAPRPLVHVVPDANRPALTLVVPCYNEAPTLAYLANTLARFEAGAAAPYRIEYVFVDDGSSDGTATKLGDLFSNHAGVQIVIHPQNRGVAAATMTGIAHARTELVGVIDCDCSYDPAEVIRMVPMMAAGTALVTASPYHPDGRVVNVPAWRLWLSRRLSQLYRVALQTQLHTYTACVRLYRKSAVDGLTIRHPNYLGIAEILARLDHNGARIVESPAVLEARILGHSKMKIVKTSFGHIGLLCELLVARLLHRPLKSVGVRT